MESIPVLVIGVGGLGRGRAEMVKEASGFTLGAASDIDEATVQRTGEGTGCTSSAALRRPGRGLSTLRRSIDQSS